MSGGGTVCQNRREDRDKVVVSVPLSAVKNAGISVSCFDLRVVAARAYSLGPRTASDR